ncbi:MAG: glucose-1-phosphate thymidylyltransferase [Candidatus Amulumruptor caecigallinarius]|nr:glucose-1-phosphate thymidylyltransferase [Candidatus Amulumruptor caecigallinarius]MCM1396336.1 glucose-1-phosphate thymidylyltransferase [Candidatus Amulumruptor caecigallinarius]MCM1453722.1 glucose-1-phosphate thymidylyltransferase [bacterium]
MNSIILVDIEAARTGLLPLTFTRPVAGIRVGALTIREKWQRMLPGDYSYLTQEYLAEKFPMGDATSEDTLFIAGNLLPDPALVEYITLLKPGQALSIDGENVAVRGSMDTYKAVSEAGMPVNGVMLRSVIDIFKLNGEQIRHDWRLLTNGRSSAPLSATVTVIGDPSEVFVEQGCDIECASINTKHGPVYIGAGVEVMEGARLRGPLAVMEGTKIKMNAMVYEDCTFGPECRIAGETANAVFQGFSNKGHDGVCLNAVIGEWCNIGAASTASNLKNNYAPVKVWSYAKKGFVKTNEQFCGLIMGDHSKLAINTSLNTATTVGVGVNFFGAGFPRTYIPSFSFGSPVKMTKMPFEDVIETARIMMGRRHVELTDADERILRYLYEHAD